MNGGTNQFVQVDFFNLDVDIHPAIPKADELPAPPEFILVTDWSFNSSAVAPNLDIAYKVQELLCQKLHH